MYSQFDPEFSAALMAFNEEASLYCNGISDAIAHDYAMEYAGDEMRVKCAAAAALPRFPAGLFEPSRNLIRSRLDNMSEKYFAPK